MWWKERELYTLPISHICLQFRAIAKSSCFKFDRHMQMRWYIIPWIDTVALFQLLGIFFASLWTNVDHTSPACMKRCAWGPDGRIYYAMVIEFFMKPQLEHNPLENSNATKMLWSVRPSADIHRCLWRYVNIIYSHTTDKCQPTH